MATKKELQELITRLEQLIQLQVLTTKRVLTYDEAALYTGISKSTLQKYTSGRKIPHSKEGKFVFFCRQQLENWMLGNPIPTAAERDAAAATYVTLNPIHKPRLAA